MNGNEPAYARAGYEITNLADTQKYYHNDGLTKREVFAMAAMQGLLAKGDYAYPSSIAEKAIRCADELIKQLSNTPNNEG